MASDPLPGFHASALLLQGGFRRERQANWLLFSDGSTTGLSEGRRCAPLTSSWVRRSERRGSSGEVRLVCFSLGIATGQVGFGGFSEESCSTPITLRHWDLRASKTSLKLPSSP